ncbi:MAG: LLM class F420-dependent oxidoreductase [Gammaproteobacteria bacterium]|jgi:probable F420-dependent oxidoreductase|nr:LLM class F420-dependent oxidoreductase [Gammaproteobacteria bacterium]MBP6050547.1 LLM class F420-dependent oxidoreductase [Pseudomonadales bacterium]MBK6583395.1 LLM class F420-dependent oxidoreductase [Gammaproteobacteria bacterium]MBK7168984.1 LLM class F420-dependent oxidoreductase [Gammaproteobacteria bacterium]MBK7521141.1 LLM class F420-dependent oxidoreductase [Gammaproteobacteria bacterium]
MHLGFSSMNTLLDPTPVVLARALEERGFDSLWYGEHSHIPVSRQTPYSGGGELPEPYKLMMDPYVSLMAAASVTTTLRVCTGIALLLERDLFSQAKSIVTLDQLSGGRVIIGTGVGWNKEEFCNVSSQPWGKRYAVMREAVAALRTLWTQDQAEYHGQYIDFDPVWCAPKPLQQPLPVIFGAVGPLGVRHAAEWADGWMPVDVLLRDIAKSVADFRRAVRDNGRDPACVSITLQAMRTPDFDTLKRYRDIGIERVNVGVAVDLWDKPEQVMPMIDHFAHVIPELKP